MPTTPAKANAPTRNNRSVALTSGTTDFITNAYAKPDTTAPPPYSASESRTTGQPTATGVPRRSRRKPSANSRLNTGGVIATKVATAPTTTTHLSAGEISPTRGSIASSVSDTAPTATTWAAASTSVEIASFDLDTPWLAAR